MIRVLIVDDETLVRLGLQTMVEWEKLGFELVGYASDGKEGLEKIRELSPDLVITDIKMPIMDGIEMIRLSKMQKTPPFFLVLSGYNDFELVKSVMKLGAVDYLIKVSLNRQVLQDTLVSLRSEINEKKEETPSPAQENRTPYDLERALHKLLFHLSKIDNKEISDTLAWYDASPLMTYYIVQVEMYPCPEGTDKENIFSYVNMCRDVINRFARGYVYANSVGRLVLVIFNQLSQQGAVSIETVCQAIESAFWQYFNTQTIFGISEKTQQLRCIEEANKQAEKALRQVFYQNESKAYFNHAWPDPEPYGTLKHECLLIHVDFLNYLNDGDYFSLQVLFQRLLGILGGHNYLREEVYECCFALGQLYLLAGEKGAAILKMAFGEATFQYASLYSLRNMDAVYAWVETLNASTQEYFNSRYNDVLGGKIRLLKQYIADNIDKHMTLNDLANRVQLSASYLSSSFKRLEGVSLTDYITIKKVEKAKELLLTGNYKIYEVSDYLGYSDAYYFSKIFKRVTDLTPTDYLSRNL